MEKLINDFKIAFTKGDTYALAIKFKNIAEDLRTAFFTVKENPSDEPLIQKSLGAGIDKIDDRAYKSEKTYKVQLQALDTINLEANVQYLYDLQVTLDNVVKTVLSGVFVVYHTVTGTSGITTASLEVAIDDELETEFSTTPATNGIEYEQDPVANAKIGDLTALNTNVKETLVGAINEAKSDAISNAETTYKILNGTTAVPKAVDAENATNCEQAENAESVNGVKIEMQDGKIITNGYTLPLKRLLWSGSVNIGCTDASTQVEILTAVDNLNGKKLEVEMSTIIRTFDGEAIAKQQYVTVCLPDVGSHSIVYSFANFADGAIKTGAVQLGLKDSFTLCGCAYMNSTGIEAVMGFEAVESVAFTNSKTAWDIYITRVYEIIE